MSNGNAACDDAENLATNNGQLKGNARIIELTSDDFVKGTSDCSDYEIPEVGTAEFERLSRGLDHRSLGYRAFKRIFDIAFALAIIAVCVLLWPITAVILIATTVSTHGSPFYTQERVAQYGRPLHILKLRTMVADSDNVEKYLNEEQLEQWKKERKVDNDPRITKFGAVCRRASIDEFPQVIHLVTGKMSLVGCRPITKDELTWFGDKEALYLSVPAGITGEWQSGPRNEATFKNGERQRLELCW